MLLWYKPVYQDNNVKHKGSETRANRHSENENDKEQSQNQNDRKYDHVSLPKLSVDDLFDDAYTSIARDGAANIEVAIRIQKSLNTIKACFKNSDTEIDKDFTNAANKLAKQSYERAKLALDYAEDIKRIERIYQS